LYGVCKARLKLPFEFPPPISRAGYPALSRDSRKRSGFDSIAANGVFIRFNAEAGAVGNDGVTVANVDEMDGQIRPRRKLIDIQVRSSYYT
jgi:hypothetical protein